MKTNRRYDPEFKREAVRLVVEEDLGVREIERNLGITYGVLIELRTLFHVDLNQLIDMKQDSVSINTVPVFDNVQLSLPQHDRRTHEFMAMKCRQEPLVFDRNMSANVSRQIP